MLALINNRDYHAEIESITVSRDNQHETLLLTGWAVDKLRGKSLDIFLEDSEGVVSRVGRPDIVRAYNLDAAEVPGFTISLPRTKGDLDIVLSAFGHETKKTINLQHWMKTLRNQHLRSRFHQFVRLTTHIWSSDYRHALISAVKRRTIGESDWFQAWIKKNEKGTLTDATAQIAALSKHPKISIVTPVYNVDEIWLRKFVTSVQEQWYQNWELCLADDNSTAKHIKPILEEYARTDPRIKVVFRERNGRISEATNSALAIATGDYIGFMDNDDELAPQALLEVAKVLNTGEPADFVYTDEDKITEDGRRFDPFFKPDYSPRLLLGHNYITHFVVVSKDLLRKTGGLRSDFDGSQDYDFILRATEQANRVVHIPQMLYHWRTLSTSVAGDPRSKMYAYEAGKRAIEAALTRREQSAQVSMLQNLGTYKIDYDFAEPSVTVVLSDYTADQVSRLKKLTGYSHVSFVQGDTEDFDSLSKLDTDYLMFLDGLMPSATEWLHEMVNYSFDNDVAVVGGKIFDQQERVLNAGITLRALKSGEAFEMRGQWDEGIGYYFRDLLPRDMFAVTEDCMLVSRKSFNAVQGFAQGLPKGLRGIDLCVRMQESLKQTALWQPYSVFTDIKNRHLSLESSSVLKYLKENPSIEDPFASAVFPDSNQRQDGIKYSVDMVRWNRNSHTIRILGWAADLHANEAVGVAVSQNPALSLKKLTRYPRPDVSSEFPVVPDAPLGFELVIDFDQRKLSGNAVRFDIEFSTTSDIQREAVKFSTSLIGRTATMARRRLKLLRHPWRTAIAVYGKYLLPFRQIFAYRNLISTTERYPAKHTREKIASLKYKPLISIVVPVYNVDIKWLDLCVESVQKQYYANWELCLADDCSTDPKVKPRLQQYAAADRRIKVVFREKNGHISRASNSALSLASGEFVALLDNDDALAPQALYEVALRLNDDPGLDVIYSDEDKIDEKGHRSDPHFKPDFSPDLLLSTNYISHLGVYRKSIIDAVGGFRVGYEGSQDYDLVLRVMECTDATKVAHISKVLYHWRTLATSTASGAGAKSYTSDAGLKALNSALKRRNLNADAVSAGPNGVYNVDYAIDHEELVTVIIPTKNGYDNVERCVSSIIAKTTYANYEILIADNGSTNSHMKDLYERFGEQLGDRFRVAEIDIPFNFSRINNLAAQQAHGKFLLFLNDDTEVISPMWMTKMVSFAQLTRIGVVGAKLIYPTETIQHAGIVLGVGGVAGHIQIGFPRDDLGYFGRLIENVNYSAVTAACCMVKASDFKAVGGFDEKLAVAYNDVDLCIRIHQQLDLDILWAHEVLLYHFESVTRGYDAKDKKKKARMDSEGSIMRKRYRSLIENDPYYNPNLSRTSGNYLVR
ncbi:MAG: Glycosyltransferase, group 2 family protein [Bifidobacterium crudilactis]|uniref:glycosyltransferase family 2 protein n=1 Tax=Bifidobacterium crudilactis TaxID=327277 RepID=UPI003A5C3097